MAVRDLLCCDRKRIEKGKINLSAWQSPYQNLKAFPLHAYQDNIHQIPEEHITAVHNGPHLAYDIKIIQRLDAIPSNLNPTQTYNAVITVINDARAAILNSPNSLLDDLIF